MSKLFISYRLADELHERLDAEIFADFEGVDEAGFERAILRHLQESRCARPGSNSNMSTLKNCSKGRQVRAGNVG